MTSLSSAIASDRPMALVVQGGGMRGAYSVAVLAELERMGLHERFDSVIGTSAGALNGAYLVTAQAHRGVEVYLEHLPNRRFIDLRRVAGKIIDIDYLIDEVLSGFVALDVPTFLASPVRLHVGLFECETGDEVWADDWGRWPLFETLRATAALPIVYGREVEILGRRYVDGGIHAPAPLERAVAMGYKDIVIVLTRPIDYSSGDPGLVVREATRLMARMKGHSPAVVRALGVPNESLRRTLRAVNDPASLALNDGPPVNVWCIAPTGPIAGRLTTDLETLRRTMSMGAEDLRSALSN